MDYIKTERPGLIYREPSLLIIICATVPMSKKLISGY